LAFWEYIKWKLFAVCSKFFEEKLEMFIPSHIHSYTPIPTYKLSSIKWSYPGLPVVPCQQLQPPILKAGKSTHKMVTGFFTQYFEYRVCIAYSIPSWHIFEESVRIKFDGNTLYLYNTCIMYRVAAINPEHFQCFIIAIKNNLFC
jgi:hypothetical protein